MPDEYIDAPIEFDEVALYNIGVARIQEYFPNWTPREGSLIDLILRISASMAAVGAEVASDVPYSIFRAFGPLAHVPPIDATPAQATSIWTVVDATGGYLIPDKTPVGLLLAGSPTEPVGFETLGDTYFVTGEQTAQIQLVATIPGSNTSGLDTVVRADSLTFVTSVVLTGPSYGGNDAELDDAFVNRLSQEFETWTTTPIRGQDFATKAKDIGGIYRCAYFENFNPADGSINNDKYVTLCPVDQYGNAVSTAVQQQLSDYIESLREVNFVAPVVSPAYSTIDVTATIHVATPSQQDAIEGEVTAMLQEYFDPASWGLPAAGQAPVWVNTPIVRYSKVVTAIENVVGVEYAENVEIGQNGGTQGTVDITMNGAFPLPRPGAINVTAVSP